MPFDDSSAVADSPRLAEAWYDGSFRRAKLTGRFRDLILPNIVPELRFDRMWFMIVDCKQIN